jgi:hypothetical protein
MLPTTLPLLPTKTTTLWVASLLRHAGRREHRRQLRSKLSGCFRASQFSI